MKVRFGSIAGCLNAGHKRALGANGGQRQQNFIKLKYQFLSIFNFLTYIVIFSPDIDIFEIPLQKQEK